MATASIMASLVELERLYWRAIRDKDAKAADALTHYPCVIVGSRGAMTIDDGSAYAGMMASASWTLHEFALEHILVNEMKDGSAVIAYKVTEEMTVDGKPLTLVAFDSSLWVKESDGRWRCALHTESIAGDSFGRDRRAD